MTTVIVTGVSKGIGRALAAKLLDLGHRVYGTVLSGNAPDGVDTFPLDLSSPDSVTACVAAFVGAGVAPDILINNAGALFDEEDTALDIGKLRRTLEVNLIGTADFTERMLPHISRGGHIVNISSTAGSLERTGHPRSHYPLHYPAYKISKAALNMYTRTLALRLKDREITVSSAHPGWVRTDMGGAEADLTPEQAADDLAALALSRPETGGFWFRGERLPW